MKTKQSFQKDMEDARRIMCPSWVLGKLVRRIYKNHGIPYPKP